MMDGYGGQAWGWDGWAAMGAMMLLVTVVAVGLVVYALRWVAGSSTDHRSFETPRATLDRRLASGEISEEEYATARRLIENRGVSA